MVHSTGALLYTVAFGAAGERNDELLQALASDPSMFFATGEAADLSAIYRSIAGALVCPGN